jgi:leader peptidase (prepilin peptidase)/N-methyltransferase
LLFCGLSGAIVGSFLNVVIDRVPAHESLLAPPSRCPGCGRRLRLWELAPIVSYLALRGRCRTCGQAISARVMWVELSSALAFVLAGWVFGISSETLFVVVALAFMIVLFVMDLEGMYVYDAILYPAIGSALLTVVVRWALGGVRLAHGGLLWALAGDSWLGRLAPPQLGALSQVLGGVVGFLLFWLIYVAAPKLMGLHKRGLSEAMGLGDTELGIYCGLLTGFPGVIVAAMSSFILGGVVAVGLLATHRVTRETYVPFGPFLLVTTALFLVLGDAIMGAYLGI